MAECIIGVIFVLECIREWGRRYPQEFIYPFLSTHMWRRIEVVTGWLSFIRLSYLCYETSISVKFHFVWHLFSGAMVSNRISMLKAKENWHPFFESSYTQIFEMQNPRRVKLSSAFQMLTKKEGKMPFLPSLLPWLTLSAPSGLNCFKFAS